MAKIIHVHINALLQPRHPVQSTSTSDSGASRAPSGSSGEGTHQPTLTFEFRRQGAQHIEDVFNDD
ncbi:hypothetical protein ACP70R_018874 [Stipagrostis hirtigluma subsp. patula]